MLLSNIKGYFQEEAVKVTLAEVPFVQYCSENWHVYGVTSRTQPDRLHVKMYGMGERLRRVTAMLSRLLLSMGKTQILLTRCRR